MPIYRVNVLQTLQAQAIMNVYYYETTGVLSAAQQQDVADQVRLAYTSSQLNLGLANGWSYDAVAIRRVDVANQPEIVTVPTGGALVGSSVSEEAPTQVAMLVRGTALTAFPRRVRTYIGGLAEGSMDSGLLNTTIQGRGLSFINAMDQIVVNGDTLLRQAVELGGTEGAPVVVANNRVETYSVTNVPATQRRRRLGVGS